MSEPIYCAYEHCQRPIEVIPGGHRRREYCNDTCRQAAHRLRKQHEQREQQAERNRIWTKYQSPSLCAVLERVRREQGEVVLMRLIAAIDEERWYVQGRSDAGARIPELAQEREQRLLRHINALERELLRVQGVAPAEAGELGEERKATRKDLLARLRELEVENAILQLYRPEQEEAAYVQLGKADVRIRDLEYHQREGELLIERQARRLQELEAERTEWTAWKEAEIVLHSQLTAMRQYLQQHQAVSIPIVRNGVTLKIVVLGNDGLAVSEDHGLVRLSDDELEQGRVFVARKTGVPVIVTRLPIGTKRDCALSNNNSRFAI
jgi:hypothetical protein